MATSWFTKPTTTTTAVKSGAKPATPAPGGFNAGNVNSSPSTSTNTGRRASTGPSTYRPPSVTSTTSGPVVANKLNVTKPLSSAADYQNALAKYKSGAVSSQYSGNNQEDEYTGTPAMTRPKLTADMTPDQMMKAMYDGGWGRGSQLKYAGIADANYINVTQANGSISKVPKADVVNMYQQGVKGDALDSFVKKGGTFTQQGSSPIGYTDTYGFEHFTTDPGNVAMVQSFADAMKNAGISYGSDFNQNAGRSYDMTEAMKTLGDGYSIEGGYMIGPSGQRVTVGLPGSVGYGNAKVDGATSSSVGDMSGYEITPEQMQQMLTQSAQARFEGMNGQYANINNWKNPYYDVTQGQGTPSIQGQNTTNTAVNNGAYQARIMTPDGQMGTGYIINDKTYLDPQGTQRVAVGTQVESRDGRVFTYNGEPVAQTGTVSNATTTPTDFASMLSSLYGTGGGTMAMPSSGDFKPTSYDEFLAKASEQISPLYEQKLQQGLNAVDIDSAQRGFFGQTPWAGQRQETVVAINAAKAEDVANRAAQLYGMSVDEAKSALSEAWNRYNAQQSQQQQLYNMMIAAQNQEKSDAQYADEIAYRNSQAAKDEAYRQAQLALDRQQTDYTTGKPYYKTSSGGRTTSTSKTPAKTSVVGSIMGISY